MVANLRVISPEKNVLPSSLVKHDSLTQAWDRIRRAHAMHTRGTPKKGVLIYGGSGSGKTFVAKQYEKLHSSIVTDTKTIRPIFYFRFKEAQKSTPDILKLLIKALGTTPPKGKTESGELYEQFILLVQSLGVELIILDEIQQVLPKSDGITALNTLKYFCALLDELSASIVFIGSTRAMSLITFGQNDKTIEDNEQLSRRMMRPIELLDIIPSTEEWVACVNWFLSQINFPHLTASDSNLLDRIYIAYTERKFATLESLFLLENMDSIQNKEILIKRLKRNFDIYCKGKYNPFSQKQYPDEDVKSTIDKHYKQCEED